MSRFRNSADLAAGSGLVHRRRVLAGLGASALLGPAASFARAQAPAAAPASAAWPTQPIKLVVPFTPGGSTDLLARVIAQKLEPILKTPVVIENRPGAGGTIAATAVAKSAPDGHTLMMGHIGTLAFNPALYPNIAYDPVASFAPVAMVATVPNILAINPGLPANSVAELIAHAKANPGKLNYGTGGNGSAAHIATAYLAYKAGITLVHVPYRGTSPAVNDLTGGHIQLMLTGGPALLPLVAGGKLRALGVSSAARAPFAPDLPTIAEAGLPGYEAVQWYGMVAPAGTPDAILARLNAEINAQLASREVAEKLASDGALANPMTPAAFGAHIKAELALWSGVIKEAGIKIG